MTQTLQDNKDLSALIDMNDLFNENTEYEYGNMDSNDQEFMQEPEETEFVIEPSVVVPITPNVVVNNTPKLETEVKKRGRRKIVKPESVEGVVDNKTEIVPVIDEFVNKSWATSLSLIPENGLEFTEFGQKTFRYERVRVNNVDTPYFICVSKYASDDWSQSNVIAPLSSRYCVVQLQKYFEELSTKTTFVGEPIVYADILSPYYMAVSANTKINTLSVFEDNATKQIFRLLTGSNITTLNGLDIQLSIMLNNTYNGTRSLRQDFILSFTGVVDGKTISFKDYFSMLNMSKLIEHTGSVEDIDTPDNIIEKIKNGIETLKSIEDVDKVQEFLCGKLPKEAQELFKGLWSGAVGEFNNMYYLLLCLSITLSNHFNLKHYTGIRTAVDRIIKQYIKD